MYHRRCVNWIGYIVGVGLLVLAADIQFSAPRGGPARQLLFSTSLLVIGLGGLAITYWTPAFTVKQLRKRNRAALGPHTYEFSDTGLVRTSPGATTTLEWANVAEVLENREFFLFYASHVVALVLPKRLLAASEMIELRTSIQKWVAERAHLLQGP